MKKRFCYFLASWLFSVQVHATTLVFDQSGNIVGSVPGTWAGQAVTYNSPASTNRAGAALSLSIQNSLSNRGYTPTDPRVTETISSISKTVGSLGAAGVGICAVACAELVTVIGAVAAVSWGVSTIIDGVSWAWDKLTPKVNSSVTPIPLGPGSIIQGQQVYYSDNVLCGGERNSVEEAIAEATACIKDMTKWQTITEISSASINSTRWIGAVSGILVGDTTNTVRTVSSTIYVSTKTASLTCSETYKILNGACVKQQFDYSKYKPSTKSTSYADMKSALQALTDAQKKQQAASEMMAEAANRLWKLASTMPGYKGLPFDANRPVTANDYSEVASKIPSADRPTYQDLLTQPTSGDPLKSPVSNPNTPVTVSPGTSGSGTTTDPSNTPNYTDPGITAPILEEPPDFFKPIADLFSGWLGFHVTPPTSSCPQFHQAITLSGRTIALDFDQHCALLEQHRSSIQTVAMVVWTVGAIFIVLFA